MGSNTRVTKFQVTNKSGTRFAVVEFTLHNGAKSWRVGNFTVGFDACHGVWRVFDWTRDEDVASYESRIAALVAARRLVERSTRQDREAVTC